VICVFEAFAGFGGGCFALNKAGVEHELVGFSEIDKYAVQCFQQNHCVPEILENDKPVSWSPKNFGDITKIDWKGVPDFDLLTGGFPCQDISIAGKQDLGKGRSVLGFELTRVLVEKRPKFFLFENVKAIQQKKFLGFKKELLLQWRAAGYVVFEKCLNSRDFGVPQNRERVWFIGYRKDIAPVFGFTPYPIETGCSLRLLDVCDSVVDEKYYLSEKMVSYLVKKINEKKFAPQLNGEYCSTITSRYHKMGGTDTYVTSPIELTQNMPQGQMVYSPEGTSITLISGGGGQGAKTGLYLFLNSATKDGYSVAEIGDGVRLEHPQSKTARGRVIKQKSNTLKTSGTEGVVDFSGRIRRLTPTECFRLMGFKDGEINLEGLSDTQKYRLAGNGWDVNLVSKIFLKMFSGVV
jgi:DNA (cytosine-5)-methyltransferase 1